MPDWHDDDAGHGVLRAGEPLGWVGHMKQIHQNGVDRPRGAGVEKDHPHHGHWYHGGDIGHENHHPKGQLAENQLVEQGSQQQRDGDGQRYIADSVFEIVNYGGEHALIRENLSEVPHSREGDVWDAAHGVPVCEPQQ